MHAGLMVCGCSAQVLLIQSGANMEAKDSSGKTALQVRIVCRDWPADKF